MKYSKYALKNEDGQYIKYPTAYRYEEEYTNSLYDVQLWDFKEDAERLANFIKQNHDKILTVVKV